MSYKQLTPDQSYQRRIAKLPLPEKIHLSQASQHDLAATWICGKPISAFHMQAFLLASEMPADSSFDLILLDTCYLLPENKLLISPAMQTHLDRLSRTSESQKTTASVFTGKYF